MDDTQIIDEILNREGGGKFTIDASDPGGATKYGITLDTLAWHRKQTVSTDDVRELTELEAREIYRRRFIQDTHFDVFANPLRWVMIDCGVLHGPLNAVKMLQRSIGAEPDGKLGPVTITVAQSWDARKLALYVQADRISFLGRRITKDLTDNDKDGVPDNAEYAWGHMNRVADQVRTLA